MNQHPGVIGRKIGMTQVFLDDGLVVACTVVEARPVVVAKRTLDKDGYVALVLGEGTRSEKHVSKPLAGAFKKANVPPQQVLKELRCTAEFADKFQVGQAVKLDEVFEEGQFVDVQGTSKGRGFTGVMRRYNFKGSVQTHGSHEYKRHGGAIGTNMTPGRTYLGKRMPGQMGNAKNTVLTQKLVKLVADKNLLLIGGGVPGARNGLVVVRGAAKRRGGKQSA